MNPQLDHDAGSDDSEGAGPVTSATDRFIATAAEFDATDLTAPTLCKGWTRAHLLAHVARHADAMVNLLTWARTGTPTFQYASAEARVAGIEAGVGAAPEELVDDLRTSAARLSAAVNDLPDEGWTRQVRRGPGGTGETIPARRVLWSRLQEVEIHHVDLDAGYSPADWPDAFVRRALPEALRSFAVRDDAPAFTLVAGELTDRLGDGGGITVTGPPAAALGWLTGRTSGTGLDVRPANHLPRLPAWK